jgi:acid stress chaperone HdeB
MESTVRRIAIILTALVLSMSLSIAWQARAQQLDLSTMTCDKFIKSDKDQMKLITAWLSGYYTDASDDEVVDMAVLNAKQNQLVQFCSRETSFPVANAADGIWGHQSSTSGDASAASGSTRDR